MANHDDPAEYVNGYVMSPRECPDRGPGELTDDDIDTFMAFIKELEPYPVIGNVTVRKEWASSDPRTADPDRQPVS